MGVMVDCMGGDTMGNETIALDRSSKKREVVFLNPDDNMWYWYDETWAEKYGPYATKYEAQMAVNKYAEEVLGYGGGDDEHLDFFFGVFVALGLSALLLTTIIGLYCYFT